FRAPLPPASPSFPSTTLFRSGELMVSVLRPLIAAAFSGLIGASVMPADAAKRQPPAPQPVVERSASGTIIQPTTTIVPNGAGGRSEEHTSELQSLTNLVCPLL